MKNKLGILVFASLFFAVVTGCKSSNPHMHHDPVPAPAPASGVKVPASFAYPPAAGTMARCSVGGELFTVDPNSPRSQYQERHYVFDCQDCKAHFDANPEGFADQ